MRAHAPPTAATLRWLFAIQLLAMGAMEMSGPFWPLHLRSLGDLSSQSLAWASAVAYAGPMAMAMLFTPLWGRLGDRTGHKPMVLRALLALAATQLWVAVAETTVTVLAARLVQGALAGFIAAAQAYGAGIVPKDKRGRLMARLQVATALGSVLGPLAGGMLFDGMGFRTLNLVAAAICIFCAVATLFALPAVRAQTASNASTDTQAEPFLRSAVTGLLLAIVLVQSGKMMPQSFFGLFAEQVLHAPAWLTGLCYGATALGICVAAPFWGKRFSDKPKAAILKRIEWICWTSAAVVALQAVSRDVATILLMRLLWGICLAALLPVFYGLLSREADEQSQGRVLGLGNSAAKAGALLGAAAGGLTLAWLPVQHAFWPVAALYAVSALGVRALKEKDEAVEIAERNAPV
ncbi:MAG TPA: MFS transporter [Noviherbaspirillum sp.]|nr:MFS transporter [Noviherbaspirillum sp.]